MANRPAGYYVPGLNPHDATPGPNSSQIIRNANNGPIGTQTFGQKILRVINVDQSATFAATTYNVSGTCVLIVPDLRLYPASVGVGTYLRFYDLSDDPVTVPADPLLTGYPRLFLGGIPFNQIIVENLTATAGCGFAMIFTTENATDILRT